MGQGQLVIYNFIASKAEKINIILEYSKLDFIFSCFIVLY